MALRLLDVSRRRRIALKLVEYPDLETVYPFHPATIVLQVSAADLELALESQGENLRPALMAAIYAALTLDYKH
jgi:hypothetical protein